jgi:hypothetical protein
MRVRYARIKDEALRCELREASYATKPSKTPPVYERVEFWHAEATHKSSVVHAMTDVLTIDCFSVCYAPASKNATENLPDTSPVKRFELAEERFSDCPSFAPVKKDAENVGVIHRSLCLQAHIIVAEDIRFKRTEGC